MRFGPSASKALQSAVPHVKLRRVQAPIKAASCAVAATAVRPIARSITRSLRRNRHAYGPRCRRSTPQSGGGACRQGNSRRASQVQAPAASARAVIHWTRPCGGTTTAAASDINTQNARAASPVHREAAIVAGSASTGRPVIRSAASAMPFGGEEGHRTSRDARCRGVRYDAVRLRGVALTGTAIAL